MSKNIEEIVDFVMPKLDSSSFREGIIIRDADRKCLREALTEGKLVVPVSREKIKQILNDNDMENNVHKAEALFQAQFGGNK